MCMYMYVYIYMFIYTYISFVSIPCFLDPSIHRRAAPRLPRRVRSLHYVYKLHEYTISMYAMHTYRYL